jgi:hypothetical protein
MEQFCESAKISSGRMRITTRITTRIIGRIILCVGILLAPNLLAPNLLISSLLTIEKAAAQSPQQRWVGDLPIMAGMAIEPELGFAFDSPGGRIVLVFATVDKDAQAVLSYYDQALSSLGWAGGNGSWRRGEEVLSLSQVETTAGRLWRIKLSPL